MEANSLPKPDLLLNECVFIASRSSGKGGQNVNKVNTKVSLRFDIGISGVLNNEQKEWLIAKLGGRVSLHGILQITSQKERTQLANKKAVIERFRLIISKAFEIPVKRKATRPSKSSKERRLKDKSLLALKKAERSGYQDIDS
ncbi:MAG: alternative ribosome rescue aminoacyl-tRNA hydrolase ArfB [Bacteroidota bacterium]